MSADGRRMKTAVLDAHVEELVGERQRSSWTTLGVRPLLGRLSAQKRSGSVRSRCAVNKRRT
jgi:hypothetical protein